MELLKVAIKTELGVVKLVPRCPVSKLFVDLLRATSLSKRDVDIIKKLGFKVQVISDQPSEL